MVYSTDKVTDESNTMYPNSFRGNNIFFLKLIVTNVLKILKYDTLSSVIQVKISENAIFKVFIQVNNPKSFAFTTLSINI